MKNIILSEQDVQTIPLIQTDEPHFNDWIETQDEHTKNWLSANNFSGKTNTFCLVPDAKGCIEKVIFGRKDEDFWVYSMLAESLPQGSYHLVTDEDNAYAALAWGLSAYQFTEYKKSEKSFPSLVVSNKQTLDHTRNMLASIYLIRDLINTPTEDMGPAELTDAVKSVAKLFKAKVQTIVGEELLKKNYPAIHAVGRASSNAPQLIDMEWGDKHHPKITLVGKGVCFDSGGLNLKPDKNMRYMKKDMGGAAHALGLARLIMAEALPVRLRVLIPAVENAVSGNAYRPGDVFKTRSGKTVEIGHTDAEGRVILADALYEAASEMPELLVDFATLTGAARVALGTDIPVLFTDDEILGDDLMSCGIEECDPVWRLPMHEGYRSLIDSPIADVCNDAASPYGGAITAALFLKTFVGPKVNWVHFDLMGWNTKSRPGRPEGGEAMGLRAVYRYLKNYYK